MNQQSAYIKKGVGAALLSFAFLGAGSVLAHEDGTEHPHPEVNTGASINVEAIPVDVVLDPKTGKPLPPEEAKRYLDMKAKAQQTQNKIKEVRTNTQEKTEALRKDSLDKAQELRTEARDEVHSMQDRIQGIRASTTHKIEDARTNLKARLGNATSSVKQRFEEQRARISAAAYERARAFLERAVRQLGAAHERLTKMADRFEERIMKLKEMGASTAEAEAGLVSSRNSLVEAQAAIELAASTLNATPSSTSDTTAEGDRVKLGEVRDLIKASQDALKTTRDSFRSLLELVRAATATLPKSIEAESALEN